MNYFRNKKGISALVATVLLILITVAAVGIIWSAVNPMISDNLKFGQACSDVRMSLQVDASSAYNCFNSSNNLTNIVVSRGVDTLNLVGLQIIASGASGSTPFDVKIGSSKAIARRSNDTAFNSAVNFAYGDIPTSNSAIAYTLNTSAIGKPDKVAVSAIVKIGATEKKCESSTAVVINSCA
jgi:flagellin-like protein